MSRPRRRDQHRGVSIETSGVRNYLVSFGGAAPILLCPLLSNAVVPVRQLSTEPDISVQRKPGERTLALHQVLDEGIEHDPERARENSGGLRLSSGSGVAHGARDRLADRL